MSNKNFKVVTFDPNLKYESINYNIQKNNSIVHDMNINLDDFERDIKSDNNNYKNLVINNENNLDVESYVESDIESDIESYVKTEDKKDYNFDELKGGSLEKIDTYLENINSLFNKKNIKQKINDLIKKYNTNKYDDYLMEINSFYSKNINKYKVIRHNNYLELIDKKTKKLVKKQKIYNVKITKEEIDILKNKNKHQKYKLINLYLEMKHTIKKNEELEKIFKKEKKQYINLNEELFSYIYYNEIINEVLNENYSLVFLPNIITGDENKIIENAHYKIPNSLIDDIYINSLEQTKLYNKIQNTKENKKKIIEEYLKKNINEKDKIKKKIKKILTKQNNEIELIY
jgi:hypothetical protein